MLNSNEYGSYSVSFLNFLNKRDQGYFSEKLDPFVYETALDTNQKSSKVTEESDEDFKFENSKAKQQTERRIESRYQSVQKTIQSKSPNRFHRDLLDEEVYEPIPRTKSPTPIEREQSDSQFVIHQEYVSILRNKVEQYSQKLKEKTKEFDEMAVQFTKLEDLAKRLHQSWQTELARAKKLENELIQRSNNEKPSDRLQMIEAKYKELKKLVENSALSNKQNEKQITNLKKSFGGTLEVFTKIFENIVTNKENKSRGYDLVQQHVLQYFDEHHELLEEYGYHEKLISILRSYNNKQNHPPVIKPSSSSSHKKRLPFTEINSAHVNSPPTANHPPATQHVQSSKPTKPSNSSPKRHLQQTPTSTRKHPSNGKNAPAAQQRPESHHDYTLDQEAWNKENQKRRHHQTQNEAEGYHDNDNDDEEEYYQFKKHFTEDMSLDDIDILMSQNN